MPTVTSSIVHRYAARLSMLVMGLVAWESQMQLRRTEITSLEMVI